MKGVIKERIIIEGIVFVPMYKIDDVLKIALEKLGLKFTTLNLDGTMSRSK